VSLEKALTALINLGLNPMDAQIYVFLAKKGPHEKSQLANALKTTDKQVCHSLRNLQEKGFVISKTEHQTIFIAVPLEKIIDNVVKTKTKEVQHLNKIEKLNSPAQAPNSPKKP